MEIIFLAVGLVAGGIAGWWIARVKFQAENNLNSSGLELEREKVRAANEQAVALKRELEVQRHKEVELTKSLSATEANYSNLQEKLQNQKADLEKLEDKFAVQFKNLANEIFDEKSKKFTEQNKNNISDILRPLGDRIINALIDQAKELTLTSRAFYNDKLGVAEKYVCETFGYNKALFMNSGAEANETAIKLARKWGYTKKGIPDNQAVIVAVKKNFHGRTTTIISASTDPSARKGFGPFMPGFEIVDYDNVEVLVKALSNPNVCGLWIEPIQGEAGVYVPQEGYLKAASELCKKHNVLLLMDEIQTGIARTGKMLASDHEGVRPDLLILGKALSGGVLPISVVLADNDIMLVIKPGEHGSTFGGNPLAAAVVVEALEVVKDERLADNAERLGVIFRDRMNTLKKKSDLITLVRGKGLLNAIVINDSPQSETAWNLCLSFAEHGLLAKPTHGNIIRLAPPLVINEEQLHECCDIIEQCVMTFKK